MLISQRFLVSSFLVLFTALSFLLLAFSVQASGSDAVASRTESQSIIIQDSEKSYRFDTVPKRIAVLGWDLAEQLLELDVTPIAIPEIDDYHTWVVQPRVPVGVEDLGLRAEPNLEKLAALKPDLIIMANRQRDLKARLLRIAPVLYFQTYSKDHNNAEAAIQTYRTLAKLVKKEALAEQKLQQMQARIHQLKGQLQQAYGEQLPKVSTLRFASTTSVYLYGENSIAQYALNQLGIDAALPQPSNQWGITQTRVLNLRAAGQDTVLYFKPFEQEKQLKKSPLWQAMPFVRAGRTNSIRSTWTYGGAMSIGYMADALAVSLLEIAPHPIAHNAVHPTVYKAEDNGREQIKP